MAKGQKTNSLSTQIDSKSSIVTSIDILDNDPICHEKEISDIIMCLEKKYVMKKKYLRST